MIRYTLTGEQLEEITQKIGMVNIACEFLNTFEEREFGNVVYDDMVWDLASMMYTAGKKVEEILEGVGEINVDDVATAQGE